MDLSKYKQAFLDDANENLESLKKSFEIIQKNLSDSDSIADARRGFHTIKSTAGTMEYSKLSVTCAKYEHLLETHVADKSPLSEDEVREVASGVKQIENALEKIAEE